MIKKIADLVNEKVITEVSDLADHSDRSGMRIQIELKRDAIPQVALNKLFKHTALQSTFGYNAVALADGVPRVMSLLEHRAPLPRLPARGRDPALEVRAAPEREARARPPRLPDRARQPRRRDRADPRLRRHRLGPPGPDERTSASPRSRRRRSSTSASRGSPASPARRSRPSTPTSQERIAELRAILGDPGPRRRADPRGAARGQAGLRPPRRPPHRDRDGRGLARARGHDRGGGHGDRDHALRLHQAAAGHDLPRAAARRHRRDGDGHEGRRLHRAPLRRLDARLHPVLHERRQGLPAQGARAPARLAPVEGPRDRQPAAVPPGRARPRRDRDARLQGVEVPRLRDARRA